MEKKLTGYHFFVGFVSGLYNCKKMDCGDIFAVIKNRFFESSNLDKDYLVHACVTFIHDYLHITSYITRYGATFDIVDNTVCVIVTDKPSDYKCKISFIIKNFRDIDNASIHLATDTEEIEIQKWNNSYLNSLVNVLAGIIEAEHAKNILKVA